MIHSLSATSYLYLKKFDDMRSYLMLISIVSFLFFSCGDAQHQDNENTIPIPTDTLKYSYQTVNSIAKDSSVINEKDLASASLVYPVLSGSMLADSLNIHLHLLAFEGGENAQLVVDSFTQFATSERAKMISDADKQAASMNGWYKTTTARIVYQTLSLISAAVHIESYVGGAHPMHITNFINLDYTGKKLTWNNILDTGKNQEMVLLNESVLKAIKQISPGRTWLQEGFLVETDSLPLPQNFAFTKDGLLIFYNEYEIAPYAMGPISYTISYAQLSGILKEGILE